MGQEVAEVGCSGGGRVEGLALISLTKARAWAGVRATGRDDVIEFGA